MSLAPGLLFAGELTGVRLSFNPQSTRLVLDLDGAFRHQLTELANPDRIVIDLPATSARPDLNLPSGQGRVLSVRTGVQDGGALRVVLDLAERSSPRTFMLPPEGDFGHRLVIDLEPQDAGTAPTHRIVDEYTGRDLVIAIDAGHGGHDPGANRNNVREKDVVLQIARRLETLIRDTQCLTPVMIRQDDRYLDLDERVRRARAANADFFVSIHADANKESSHVSGATVYSITTDRALRENERLLAQRQSTGDALHRVNLAEQNDTVAGVLLDLARDASVSKSRVAGELIIHRLSRVTSMNKTSVMQKSLAVLTSPDIPSLLVEAAFVTNPRDAARLRDAGFQQDLARALQAGIVDFFRDYPPTDSCFARNPPPVELPPIRHVISRGETLSEIAERYRISLSELRRTNQIAGDTIRIGQVLTIPTRI